MKQAIVKIDGMTCQHCLSAVTKALSGQPGATVEAVRIGWAEITYDEAVTGPEQLAAVVEAAGYRVASVAHEEEG